MIWFEGRILKDDELKISVYDRAFEHGLGLFETFRTWKRHPTLLSWHLERMKRAARMLGIELDPSTLPDTSAVRALLDAEGFAGDALFRITTSGGLSEETPPVVWMRASRPSATFPAEGARVRASWLVTDDDEMASYKSLNYLRRRRLFEAARDAGFDEDLGTTAAGHIVEGTRTNVFAIHEGRLFTPGEPDPLLQGIMRAVVLEYCQRTGWSIAWDEPVTQSLLWEADEVFLTNSVRGIIPVRRVGDVMYREYPAPGPLTEQLWKAILFWLESGGPST